MASDSGYRFIEDLTSEPHAVQQAISSMIDEMRAERKEEDRERAETKATAVEAVESAIATAARHEPQSRLAGWSNGAPSEHPPAVPTRASTSHCWVSRLRRIARSSTSVDT